MPEVTDEVLDKISARLNRIAPNFCELFAAAYLNTYGDNLTRADIRDILQSGAFEITTHLPNSNHLIKTEVKWIPNSSLQHFSVYE